jgi:LAGLIDADG endonuclease
LLDPLIHLYGGSIYVLKTAKAFKWIVFRKEEIIKLYDYFKEYPLRSVKHARIKMIARYFELRSLKAHKAIHDSSLGKS